MSKVSRNDRSTERIEKRKKILKQQQDSGEDIAQPDEFPDVEEHEDQLTNTIKEKKLRKEQKKQKELQKIQERQRELSADAKGKNGKTQAPTESKKQKGKPQKDEIPNGKSKKAKQDDDFDEEIDDEEQEENEDEDDEEEDGKQQPQLEIEEEKDEESKEAPKERILTVNKDGTSQS
mgnify:CR=1 FL=1